MLWFEENGVVVSSKGVDAFACLGQDETFDGCPVDISSLRCNFLQTIPSDGMPGDDNLAFWDITRLVQRESQNSICLTVLLMVVILIMYVMLSMDVTQMVVQPIESMVGLVRCRTSPTWAERLLHVCHGPASPSLGQCVS